MRFEGKDLVEVVRILALADDVPPYADVDGEDGHHDFRTYRKPDGKLFAEGWTVEFQIVCRSSRVHHMTAQVGTLVILCVEREPGTEVAAHVIHRVEVQPQYAEVSWQ